MNSTGQIYYFYLVTEAEADSEMPENFKYLCQLNTKISSDTEIIHTDLARYQPNFPIKWEKFSGNSTGINSDKEIRNSKKSKSTE
jgi:hypothetical protein